MVGTVVTATVVAIEVCLVYRQLNREGLLDPMKAKATSLYTMGKGMFKKTSKSKELTVV